jgi:flagellar biosynthesis GTPase FlhF
MFSRQWLFIAAVAGLFLFIGLHAGVRGQEKAPARPAAPTSGTIALASPLRWNDRADTRPLELIPQAEQEKSGLEFLRAYRPLRADEIERTKPQNPHDYYQALREAFGERMEMERQRVEDPEGFSRREQMLRFDARCEQLGLDYRKADLDKKPSIERLMKELVNQLFELRQAQMEERLKEMEREYLNLKNNVEKRRKNKDRVVEIRILQLMGDADIFQMW